jgi:hypothetical protein
VKGSFPDVCHARTHCFNKNNREAGIANSHFSACVRSQLATVLGSV